MKPSEKLEMLQNSKERELESLTQWLKENLNSKQQREWAKKLYKKSRELK
jgi:hypothetical protein